jgi:hypothetical protein
MRMTAAAGLAVLALVTGGCGGGQTFTPTGTAAGRPPAGGTAEPGSPTAHPSAAAGDGLAFPADFQVLYQPRTASPGGAAAVRDFGRFWRAWWYAVVTGGADTRYRDYVAPKSLLGGTGFFSTVVDGWAREKLRPTGTIRAYAVRVLSVDAGGRVLLVGCGDESKAGTKNVNTGAVSRSFGRRTDARYKIRVAMSRGADGRWQIDDYQPVPVTDPVGRECRG